MRTHGFIIMAVCTLTACQDAQIGDNGPTPASAPAPAVESCGNGIDDDADGQVDEGCACDPQSKTEQQCYPGPASQIGVGRCRAGKQQCLASGGEFSSWGPCQGAVLPAQEDPKNGVDDDCDGEVDETGGTQGVSDGGGAQGGSDGGTGSDGGAGTAGGGGSGAGSDGGTGSTGSGSSPGTDGGTGSTGSGSSPGTGGGTGSGSGVVAGKELCGDGIDNDGDGQIDEGGCLVEVTVNINGDCVWASCPPAAPHPVACDIVMQGGDCRGCIANSPGSSGVYFQEGNQCGAGHVSGALYCSSVPGNGLNSANCYINKTYKLYKSAPTDCPELGDGDGC